MRRFREFIVASLLLGGLVCGASGTFSDDQEIEQEYLRRFKLLDANDLTGHYDLALWCKDNEAYPLLKKQCAHILRRKADHEPAKLLLELAEAEMAASGATDAPSKGGTKTTKNGSLGRLVTDEEIQIMRRKELLLDQPDRVQVRIPREVLDQFFTEMQGSKGFDYSRKRFFGLPPSEKAQLILRHAREAYEHRLEITTDPERFVQFERTVLPFVKANCATAGCHAPNGQAKWRIYNDRILTKNMVYTNYLLMHDFEIKETSERMIDRDFPKRSLLLQYGLPNTALSEERRSNHPSAAGEIEPAFRDTQDPRYRDLLTWLESLDVQAPDYGISLNE